ncbi:glutamate racemase [Cohaesibacter celericrescens]|uniref:glutamate racemase n=1 Tax=Cohaesibacter celericrescens TaxID=2067669 RepID=UPI003561E814
MFRDKDPRILVFDSGFGGLSVLSALVETLPFADYIYLADDARFPYGDLSDDALTNGLIDIIRQALQEFSPDLLVVACNTASTVALKALREAFAIPIVGIVPAIKLAASATRSRRFAVLATPGTIRRSFTRDLINDFAAGCSVDLIACTKLAGLAEDFVLNGQSNKSAVWSEIESAFCIADGPDVDVIVLGCTHYPLLLPVLLEVAPRPVLWLDPAPAVARRVMHLLGQEWQDCLADSNLNNVGPRFGLTFVATGGGEDRLRKAWIALRGCS